jgi:superfamily II DNA or RNA helicase
MSFRLTPPTVEHRHRLAQAHAELLLERFAGLNAADKTAIELIAIADVPIRVDSLAALLRLSGLDPAWREHSVADLARLLLRLRELVIDPRAAEVRAQGGPLLQRAALLSLVESGRAALLGAALTGNLASALERIEPEYRSGVRLRLRMAGILAGLAPEQLALGAYLSPHNDPISDALLRIVALLHSGDAGLVDRLHPGFRPAVLGQLLQAQLRDAEAGEAELLARAHAAVQEPWGALARLILPLLELHAHRGEPMPAVKLSERFAGLLLSSQIFDALRQGRAPAECLADYELALRSHRSEHGGKALLPGLAGKLHLACLSLGHDAATLKRREQLVKLREVLSEEDGGIGVGWWQQFSVARMSGHAFAEPADLDTPRRDDIWWLALLLRWTGSPWSSALRERLQAAERDAERAGWRWLAQQIASLLRPDEIADADLHPPLRDWVQPQARWESALDALAEALALDGGPRNDSGSHSQLRILVKPPRSVASALQIEFIEQRPRAGGYTAGRALATPAAVRGALERLPPGDDPDRRVLNALLAEPAPSLRHGLSAGSRTLAALVDHPRVFARDDESPLQVAAGSVELVTRRLADGQIELRLAPAEAARGEALVQREGSVLRVYRPDPALLRIADIVGDGLSLPEQAADRLLALLPDLSRKLTLNADLAQLGVAEVAADSSLHALLEPWRDGLGLRLVVRPLGPEGPQFAPGQGPESVLGHGGGRTRRTQRDLAGERAALERLVQDCPLLEALDDAAGLQVEDPEAALDLLAQLQAVQPPLPLAWREGRALRVARPRGEGGLQLQVQAQRDWFAASGGLALDDGNVVSLAELLRALPSAQGRYLRLDDERVLALNHALHRRLLALQGFADEQGRVQVGAAAALALDSLLDDDSERDPAFAEQIRRMEAAQSLQPALPASLQASLRDYQVDGYRFAMRLAAAGFGACLADDMGLGKTVQALAVLAARGSEGPALVVAPTSVVGNWRRETERFAPSLALRIYGDGDREQALKDLGPHDLMLVSYGLLAASAEAFAAVPFATLVLDEAQAIKNSATQRAQAVRRLNAQFRLALSGTPLENHLGELWSLFRVINPGLLGSEAQFRQRYLLPLERDPRAPQRDALRRLIAPFLLRRTKAEVLQELPSRTEIVLQVEPSADEARLLAALRRQAVQRLQEGALAPDQRRVHILAELTRLRRAACHPQLVAPELGLTSSKLEQLVELVLELTDNQHRALVFSQFVDYLTLVRERLDREGVRYQYLDGSTPTKAREAAVAAFQAGEGEVFLLSLKAGGVGLNLTAADYVIHLDPWWNPAVEQQASDRAHRIGQTRPVTVYKLVLAGSIEEQILALHGSKRELVDQVIGDGAAAGPVSADELLELLTGD